MKANGGSIVTHMTEEEANLSAVRFANDMCKATRAATIEECAKVAEEIAIKRRENEASKGFSPASATPVANAYWCEEIAEAIRSLHHSHQGLEREE